MKAYVLVKVTTGQERQVMEALLDIPNVHDVHVLFGDYDYMIEIESADSAALGRLVTDQIRKVPGVEKTMTLMVTSLGKA